MAAPLLLNCAATPTTPKTKATATTRMMIIVISVPLDEELLLPVVGTGAIATTGAAVVTTTGAAVGIGIGTDVGAGIGTALGSCSGMSVGTSVAAAFGKFVGGDVGMADGIADGMAVGGTLGVDVGMVVGRRVGIGVGGTDGSGDGAGVGENVSTETDRTDADDIERRRPALSSPAEVDPSRRWPSAVAKSTSAAVRLPSATDALSILVTCCMRRNAHALCVGRFPLRRHERRGELPLRRTAVTHNIMRTAALTSCTEIPNVAAITSGSVTSFDTKTEEADDASSHIASEKVEF